MSYLILALFSLAFILLFLMVKRTTFRNFFEYKYEQALRRKHFRQAEKWGRLYYGSLTSAEKKENGIKDIKAIVEREIHNYAA